MFYFLFLSQPVEFPSVPEKELTPFVEILFEDNANTLCCQICPGVVAVVCFVVRFQADVSGTVDEPFCFKVSHLYCTMRTRIQFQATVKLNRVFLSWYT